MVNFRSKSFSSKKADSTVFIFLAALAVAVPTVFFLWSVALAMENDSAARRQEQSELNQLKLREVRRNLNGYLSRLATGKVGPLQIFDAENPRQCFRQFAKRNLGDGLIILDENQEPLYPLLTRMRKRSNLDETELQALDLRDRFALTQASIRRSLSVLNQFATPELKNARDTTGRLIYPGLILSLLDQLESDHPRRAAFVKNLVRSLNHPSMPTSQRLFLAQELSNIDPSFAPVHADFYSLSLEILGNPIQLPTSGALFRSSEGGHWVLLSDDSRFLTIFREDQLVSKFTEIASEGISELENLRVEIAPPQAFDSSSASTEMPLLTLPGSTRLPGWELRAFSVNQESPVSTGRRNFYLATAAMALALVGGLAWLASRSYLRQAKETQLRNDFLSTVSHELRTPLTSIRMLVDTLAAGHYKDPERTKKYLDVIARENSRLSHLVETFLTYTRMERGKLKFDFHPTSPAEIAEQASASVHERFKAANVNFDVKIPEKLPQIDADPETLSSALINLLDNAFKYTGLDKCITLRVRESRQKVHFEVIDNGEGLIARDRKLIVERFYRTDSELTRNSGGSGLGLSIVKFIVEGHGGSLEIASEPGKGSTFTITIPTLEK